MKRLVLFALLLCLAATPSFAFTDNPYGTWLIQGTLDHRYSYDGDRYEQQVDFDFEIEVGQVPWDEVANYNTDKKIYRPLASIDNVQDVVEEIINGQQPHGTVNYLYLPEEYSDLNQLPSTFVDDIYVPYLDFVDIRFSNTPELMWLALDIDDIPNTFAGDYQLSATVYKQMNVSGGYDFKFSFDDNNIYYIGGAPLYTYWNEAIGTITQVSTDYITPNPVAAPIPEPGAPSNPSPVPDPGDYDPGEDEPAAPVYVPTFDDDGR